MTFLIIILIIILIIFLNIYKLIIYYRNVLIINVIRLVINYRERRIISLCEEIRQILMISISSLIERDIVIIILYRYRLVLSFLLIFIDLRIIKKRLELIIKEIHEQIRES